MTSTNSSTLDPEEIGRLPLDRSQPFNGLTEAQVRAIGAVEEDARATNEAEAERLKRQLAATQVTELRKDLKSFVDSVPGVHEIAPQVELQIVQDLQASGLLPSTPQERAVVIETALRK